MRTKGEGGVGNDFAINVAEVRQLATRSEDLGLDIVNLARFAADKTASVIENHSGWSLAGSLTQAQSDCEFNVQGFGRWVSDVGDRLNRAVGIYEETDRGAADSLGRMGEYPHNTPDGEKVSESLRVASTEFDTLDPDRDNPDHRRAAAIASNYLHTAADAERGFSLDGPTSQEVKRDLSSVLSYYYEDVNNALIGGDAGGSEVPIGMQDANAQDDARRLPESEMGFTTGAAVQYDDATTLLNTVWDDETSQRRVLGAATVYSNESIQNKVDHWDSINNTGYDSLADARSSGYRDYGANLRGLVDAVYAEEISNAESNQEIAKIMKPVVQVGLVASGPGGLGAAALGGVANASLDELGGGVAEAQDAYDGDIRELKSQSNAAVAEMMLRRGEWEPSQLPEEIRAYWSEDQDRFVLPNDADDLRRFHNWASRESDAVTGDAHSKFLDGLQIGS